MKKYKLKTLREEKPNREDYPHTFAVLGIFDTETNEIVEELPYIISEKNHNVHVFFKTYFNAFEFLSGDRDFVRCYMTEELFDTMYDNGIDDLFSNIIDWVQ